MAVKGRKMPKGTEGVVGWEEQSNYAPCVCIDGDDGVRYRYITVSNLEVVDPEQYCRSDEEAEAYHEQVLNSKGNWHLPVAYGRGYVVV